MKAIFDTKSKLVAELMRMYLNSDEWEGVVEERLPVSGFRFTVPDMDDESADFLGEAVHEMFHEDDFHYYTL